MKESKQRSTRETRKSKMLEVPPEWNEVPDLMMEEEDVLPKVTGSSKRRHGEVSRGQIKWQKEDDIQPQKRGHSPTVSWRIQNPEGFYSEDWNEVQQEEDEWQELDKWHTDGVLWRSTRG